MTEAWVSASFLRTAERSAARSLGRMVMTGDCLEGGKGVRFSWKRE